MGLSQFGDLGLDVQVEHVDQFLLPDGACGRLDAVLDENVANQIHFDGPWVEIRTQIFRQLLRRHCVSLCDVLWKQAEMWQRKQTHRWGRALFFFDFVMNA